MSTTVAVTRLHAICPHCGDHSKTLDHLKEGQTFGPWYCDSCGRAYNGTYKGADTVLVKDPRESRKIDTLVLLEYPPSDKPLRFLIEGMRFVDKKDLSRHPEYGGPRYFYEEHSCPTNWLKHCTMVAFDGDTDPHGFLRYVRDIDRPDLPENCMDEDEALRQMFPEMLDRKPLPPRE